MGGIKLAERTDQLIIDSVNTNSAIVKDYYDRGLVNMDDVVSLVGGERLGLKAARKAIRDQGLLPDVSSMPVEALVLVLRRYGARDGNSHLGANASAPPALDSLQAPAPPRRGRRGASEGEVMDPPPWNADENDNGPSKKRKNVLGSSGSSGNDAECSNSTGERGRGIRRNRRAPQVIQATPTTAEEPLCILSDSDDDQKSSPRSCVGSSNSLAAQDDSASLDPPADKRPRRGANDVSSVPGAPAGNSSLASACVEKEGGRSGRRSSSRVRKSTRRNDPEALSWPAMSLVRTRFGSGILSHTRRTRRGDVVLEVNLSFGKAFLQETEVELLDDEARKVLNRPLVAYPKPSAKGAVEIGGLDLLRLQPGVFLNDQLVDFYLKYLFETHAAPERGLAQPFFEGPGSSSCGTGGGAAVRTFRERFYFFNQFFYSKLSEGLTGSLGTADKAIAQQQDLWRRLQRWTRGEDLMSKDFLVVPINGQLHWSVAIICNPGAAPPLRPTLADAAIQAVQICRGASTLDNDLDNAATSAAATQGSAAEFPVPEDGCDGSEYLKMEAGGDGVALPSTAASRRREATSAVLASEAVAAKEAVDAARAAAIAAATSAAEAFEAARHRKVRAQCLNQLDSEIAFNFPSPSVIRCRASYFSTLPNCTMLRLCTGTPQHKIKIS